MPLIVPCHRVIGADGELHGYSGGGDRGLELKKRLLDHEQRVTQTVAP
ncbi:MAG: MGMT family protein [Halobacteriales archaeon]|nr:MGMT family protein [Halobacteriales archaeon]